MRRVSPGSRNRGAPDGDDFTPHSPLLVSSNGLRLSGARKGVRCSRGFGGLAINVFPICDPNDEYEQVIVGD